MQDDTTKEVPKIEEKPLVRDYFFPAQGVTIQATSKEEAEAKLVENSKKEITNNK